MVRLSRLAMDWARFSISGGRVTESVRVLLMLSIIKRDLAISIKLPGAERSMRICLLHPHARSRDPCTPARASDVSGSSAGITGQWESLGNSAGDTTVESHPSKSGGWAARGGQDSEGLTGQDCRRQ